MNPIQASHNDPTCDSYRYIREGVLLWDTSTSEAMAQQTVRLVTEDGVYPMTSWLEPPYLCDPHVVDKVCAVILSLPNNQMYLVSVQRDPSIDPIEVMPPALCPVPSVPMDVYELLQRIDTPALRRFVRDVFSLSSVFLPFWQVTAGSHHHAWPGGLAVHSLDVSLDVVDVMDSPTKRPVHFSRLEYELGMITALLHDVGKTVSYNGEGYCTERALVIGHELLGVELIRKPLDTLRAARADLADALTALLLSRTRFSNGRYRLEAIRQVVSKADRESAKRNTKPR
jgi:hypothetical protein